MSLKVASKMYHRADGSRNFAWTRMLNLSFFPPSVKD
jgi:hypothetical protein